MELVPDEGDQDAGKECADGSKSLVVLAILVTVFNIFSLFPFLRS